MYLALYVEKIKIKFWPLTMPAPDRFLSDKENFCLRTNYVQELVAAAKLELADLMSNHNHEFVIEVRASVQPGDFDTNKDLASAPVIKLQRPPAIYSRVPSRYDTSSATMP